MVHGQSRNPNHPKKGAAIKVEPIRSLDAIASIKALLADKPRDLCLFSMGINTAFRASELLSIRIGQVAYLQVGDLLELKQSKTKKYRATPLNKPVIESIRAWLAVHPAGGDDDAPLFASRTGEALLVSTVSRMVKTWCEEAGLKGNYGSHTLRKTWGYQQRMKIGTAVPILMEAYGHTSQKQTLDYLGIQSEEVMDIYLRLEL